MSVIKRIKEEGISLRLIHSCLIVLAMIVSWLLIVATYHCSTIFLEISRMTDEYIEMHDAADQLMEGSDYLTEMAQRYTLNGDIEFLNRYFEEVFETRRREEALEKMSADDREQEALEWLDAAMSESLLLMNREYYAMRLVLEATGDETYPDELRAIELEEAHKALTSSEKMELAQQMVLGNEYYIQKDRIRSKMKESVEQLEKTTHGFQQQSHNKLKEQLRSVRVVIIFQTISILFMIWLTSHLGIRPVLKAVDRIRDDSPIPVIGANEFRYLARTYNKMYNMYKNSVAKLNFKASHDALTKVYNRSGYDLLLTSIDLATTCMIILDVDYFKEVNDTYGHETGDEALCRVANAILVQFRSDDYVCRIGGDEFVVFMVHANKKNRNLISRKISRINEILSDHEDGAPALSVSAGAAFGEDVESPRELFEHADQALYETKRQGRHGITIYNAEQKGAG
ncbi:MAG: diguanylate cyclase [Clostridia bacterium]|nr:diguanylate cyclase [Clostridia bacterium]